MHITIFTIPHNLQRYPTVGDWQIYPNGNMQIRISEMKNPDHEFLVALHELVEVYLCQKRGITDEEVTAFDINFENKRIEDNTDEPGDEPNAPYQNEHLIATGIEKLVAAALGIKWKEYDAEVNAL